MTTIRFFPLNTLHHSNPLGHHQDMNINTDYTQYQLR